MLSFLHQFHQLREKYLCGPSCFKNSGSQSEKTIPDQQHSKIPHREFKSWSTIYLKPIITDKKLYIHDFFEPVSNNASWSSPFTAAVVGYFDILTFFLITTLAVHKDNVSSIPISTLHTCVLFIICFFCIEAKRWSQWQNQFKI